MTYFFFLWFLLVFIFVYVSKNLLLSLIVLEVISFISIFLFAYSNSFLLFSDYYFIVFFSIFVIEGVIGLSGLIILVFFTGSDYIRISRVMKI